MKRLEGLEWHGSWVTHVGALKGCLDFLGAEISWPWLMGGCGQAFVLNLHEVVCPSGPTAFDSGPMLSELAPNVGCGVSTVSAIKTEREYFAARQREAWDAVRSAIDEGLPCYGWELGIPEYHVIDGYDETGYLYRGVGAEDGAGPKPWQELGGTAIGVLSVHVVRRCEPAEDAKVVADACAYAVAFGRDPGAWVFPRYRSGVAGFEAWAEALERGTAIADGHGYNGRVWHACREAAVGFLRDGKARLPGRCDALFDAAIAEYEAVAERLREVCERRPWNGPVDGFEASLRDAESAALVREAGRAEARGLDALEVLGLELRR